MRGWYVCQTHPREEERAAQHLARQGFGVYMPRVLKRRSHARRVEMKPAPLFPSYIFIALDPARDRWRSVLSTLGVRQLVGHGGMPQAVPPQVIDEIRAREDEQGWVRLNDGPRSGDRVRIAWGPLADAVGIF
jgi:transcriptional antiterminator RfaH